MSQITRDDAMRKVAKCMALSKSAEPNEAAAAMRQAQKLMAEHNITAADLSLSSVRETAARASSKLMVKWEVALCDLVGESFGCESFSRYLQSFDAGGNFRTRRDYVFVGIDAASQVAAYTFEVLTRQCAKARLAHIAKQPRNCKAITKTVRGDEFALGWVRGVTALVERFAQPAQHQTLLLTYLEQKHPDLKPASPRNRAKTRKTTDGHHSAGYDAAGDARLDRGVGTSGPNLLLG